MIGYMQVYIIIKATIIPQVNYKIPILNIYEILYNKMLTLMKYENI